MSDLKKYLKLFNNHDGYEEFTGSTEYIKPNVSRCEEEKHVHYGPTPRPTAITFVETAITVNILDEQVQIEAVIEPSDVKNKTIVWKSSNPKVATVDDNGLVTLKATGTFNIMAKTIDGSDYALCNVKCVKTMPESISLNKNVLYIAVGSEYQLEATILPPEASQEAVWTASDESIATVSDGLVEAVSVGNAVVTAACKDKQDITASCAVECVELTAISINESSIVDFTGTTHQLSAITEPEGLYATIIWESGDESIATVDENGLVTIVGEGETIITGTAKSTSLSVTCSVEGMIPEKLHFSFKALSNSTVKANKSGFSGSTDNGDNWFALGTSANTLEAGKKMLVKGNYQPSYSNSGLTFSASTGEFEVEGNIMSLFYGDDFVGKTTIPGHETVPYRLQYLFKQCSGLTSVENLRLPCQELHSYDYYCMFLNCTNLKKVMNVLDAETMAPSCYQRMFSGCTSLTTIPETLLPATTLAGYCYNGMFGGCGLTEIPENILVAKVMADYCYGAMFSHNKITTIPEGLFKNVETLATSCFSSIFSGNYNLVDIPEKLLPFMELKTSCYYGMFINCSGLTQVPPNMLPATELATYCYADMFEACTNLTDSPILPAPFIARTAYFEMFLECYSLTSITCSATSMYDDGNLEHLGTYRWTGSYDIGGNEVRRVGANGILYRPEAMNWYLKDSINGIPKTWTSPGPVHPRLLVFDDNTLNIAVGETWHMGYSIVPDYTDPDKTGITWASDDENIATVDENGNITAHATGFCNIIGTTIDGGHTDTCAVRSTIDYKRTYLTFTALQNTEFSFTKSGVYYSTDEGSTWTTLPADERLYMTTGDRMLFKGNITPSTSGMLGVGSFWGSGSVKIEGCPSSLLYGGDSSKYDDISDKPYAFAGLFSGSFIGDLMDLRLPSVLSEYCFSNMFRNTNISEIPNHFYKFLPATTLKSHCYDGMFYMCSSLTTLPDDLLHSTTLAPYCYANMFRQCTGLTNLVNLEFPAMTLTEGCYQSMFYSCGDKLLVGPILPAPTLVSKCYNSMFYSNKYFHELTCYAKNPSNSGDALTNWLYDTQKNSGRFHYRCGVTWPTDNNSGVPLNWNKDCKTIFD